MQAIVHNYKKNKMIYWLALPIVAYFIVFNYIPMAGLVISFQKYNLSAGIFGSKWVGLDNFRKFFQSVYFGRTLRNTLLLSLYDLLFTFPSSIILAFLLNEVKSSAFKRTIQTVSYLPHFLSMVVIAGLIREFTTSNGFITQFYVALGGSPGNLLGKPQAFRAIFVGSNVWQSIGFSSIIYLAALSSVSEELYDAAKIDGAGYFQQWLHVTLPGISTTIIIMLILRIGQTMNVNFEKVLLLYSSATYETADVISTYVYRQGILGYDFGYSTAVGLFNSVIGFLLILGANYVSKRYTEVRLF